MTILQGTQVNSFKDRDLEVKILLNNSKETKSLNQNKRNPILLQDIKASVGVGYVENAVVVDAGSHISFSYSSVGPCGYGINIWTKKEAIAKGIYSTNQGTGKRTGGGLSEYLGKKRTICVEDKDYFTSEGDSDVFDRWKVSIISYRLLGYSEDAEGKVKYGTARGEVQVDVAKGYTTQGVDSSQSFGGLWNVSQDDPENHANGSINMYFFVFKPGTKVEELIAVNQAPDPNAFD